MNREDLPTFLMKLRKRHGLSQQNVAEVLGMNYSSYGKYENGLSRLKLEQAEKLAELYGISLNDFADRRSKKLAVNEEDPSYGKRNKVQIVIELDGTKAVLEKTVNMITNLNESIAKLYQLDQ